MRNAVARGLERLERTVQAVLGPRRVVPAIALLLALKLATFCWHATHAPAAAGDETFTVVAVEELRRTGDVYLPLRAKRHHPLPYLILAGLAPAESPAAPVAAAESEVGPANPILFRSRLVSLAAWLLSAVLVFSIARLVMPRPAVALAIFLALPMLIAFEARPYAIYLLLTLLAVYASLAVLYARPTVAALAAPASLASLGMALYTFIFGYLFLPPLGLAALARMRRSPIRGAVLAVVIVAAFAVSAPYLLQWLRSDLPAGDQPHPLLEATSLPVSVLHVAGALGAFALARAFRTSRETAWRVSFSSFALLTSVHTIAYWGLPFAAIGAAAYVGATSATWWLLHGVVAVPMLLNPEPCFRHHALPSAALVAVPLAFVLQRAPATRLSRLAAAAIVWLLGMSLLEQ